MAIFVPPVSAFFASRLRGRFPIAIPPIQNSQFPIQNSKFKILMAQHNNLGKWGEQLAADLLVTKGYAIAARNWRAGNLEIDIVAMKGSRIVFVEVKTRMGDFDEALRAIDRRREMRMVRAANSYVKAFNLPHEVQFDVVIVVGDPMGGTLPRIEHIEDAFLPPLRTVR